ncbi:MAG: zinc ribbon-containing protein [Gammaproteobacteria bacterium]|nr:zinc ribbon-containing protein [Gammaproteobacteria bacterium]
MAPGQQPFGSDRLVEAYNRMLERIHDTFRHTGESAVPALQKQIDHARETAVELGELSREEADRIGEYLRRDAEEVARYLEETRQDFRDWFRFDLQLVEQRFMQMFELMVDQTRMELDRLSQRAAGIEEFRTGEVAAPGSLFCAGCEKELHFHETGRIPPCPRCHGTVYRRFSEAGIEEMGKSSD